MSNKIIIRNDLKDNNEFKTEIKECVVKTKP